MKLVAGIDIGNATTESSIGPHRGRSRGLSGQRNRPHHGHQGDPPEHQRHLSLPDQRLGEGRAGAQGAVGGAPERSRPRHRRWAMETITETIITESTMIGHNPATPGGMGVGVGETVLITELEQAPVGRDYIAVVPGTVDFEVAARLINRATAGIARSPQPLSSGMTAC